MIESIKKLTLINVIIIVTLFCNGISIASATYLPSWWNGGETGSYSTNSSISYNTLGTNKTLTIGWINNTYAKENNKDLWIELTWWSNDLSNFSLGTSLTVWYTETDPNVLYSAGLLTINTSGNGTYSNPLIEIAEVEITPQPSGEEILIPVNITSSAQAGDSIQYSAQVEWLCSPTPEPSTMILVGIGLLGLAITIKLKRSKV
jgi:hypothetical protein